MGNRFRGGIADGAMPFLHQYLGNPVLTGLGRLFFKSKCGDFHCGIRGFRQGQLPAHGHALDWDGVCQRDGGEGDFAADEGQRGGNDSVARWTKSPAASADLAGWHGAICAFLLMYSPRWLFLYPGIALDIWLGLAGCAWLLPGPQFVRRHRIRRAHPALCVRFRAAGLSACWPLPSSPKYSPSPRVCCPKTRVSIASFATSSWKQGLHSVAC